MLAHRGANGIDGTVSAAFGAAAVADGPIVLHIGDVALAHDVPARCCTPRASASRSRSCSSTTAAAASSTSWRSPASATRSRSTSRRPPAWTSSARPTCSGLGYAAPATRDELAGALAAATAAPRRQLVHVRTDRARNVALHREVWEAVSAAVRSAR